MDGTLRRVFREEWSQSSQINAQDVAMTAGFSFPLFFVLSI